MATKTQLNIDQWADQKWRLNNLYWIADKDGNRIPFEMNDAQADFYDRFWHRNVLLKARQRGFSTLIQLLMLDSCVFDPDIKAGVIAQTREDAEEIFKSKIRFGYDNLPEGIRGAVTAQEAAARHLTFSNGSGIRVGTSLRSGTYQYLHVSEFGKICAKFPDKAREIKTGAFNTVPKNGFIAVESTAEGQEGEFYDMCERAQAKQRRREPLTPLDFKFFFYPWWDDPQYRLLEPVEMTHEQAEYFRSLKDRGIELDDAQKAWYAKMSEEQGSDMKREYPSFPEEAFEAAIEGAYYADLLAKADTDGRVGRVVHEPDAQVETWWDLGMGDLMSVWFVQRVGQEVHVIDYYQNSGEGLAHYASMLQEKQGEHGYVYGPHIWPHDGRARILDEKGRRRTDVFADLGYDVEVVERGRVDEGIEAVRNILPKCWFDRAACERGLAGLRMYRKDWDDLRGTWKKEPRHDGASHPADAFRTGAMFTPSGAFADVTTAPELAIA